MALWINSRSVSTTRENYQIQIPAQSLTNTIFGNVPETWRRRQQEQLNRTEASIHSNYRLFQVSIINSTLLGYRSR